MGVEKEGDGGEEEGKVVQRRGRDECCFAVGDRRVEESFGRI